MANLKTEIKSKIQKAKAEVKDKREEKVVFHIRGIDAITTDEDVMERLSQK